MSHIRNSRWRWASAVNGDPAAGQYSGKVGVLTMPGSGLVSIGDYAFCGCTNATGTMNFPDSLTSVGQCVVVHRLDTE